MKREKKKERKIKKDRSSKKQRFVPNIDVVSKYFDTLFSGSRVMVLCAPTCHDLKSFYHLILLYTCMTYVLYKLCCF